MRRALLFFALCPLLVSCASSPPPAATNPAPTTATAPPAPSSAPVVATVAPASAAPPATLEERVAKLQREAIVVDTHNDITSAILEEGFDLANPTGTPERICRSCAPEGISAEFFSIYVDSVTTTTRARAAAAPRGARST